MKLEGYRKLILGLSALLLIGLCALFGALENGSLATAIVGSVTAIVGGNAAEWLSNRSK